MKILVVDDSTVARMMTARAVTELYPGCTILQAADGQLALELLEEDANEIELALLDYNMPGLNGLELGELLSKVIPEARQILCTANSQNGLQKRAEEQGLEVLHKPITAERLASCIENSEKTS